MRRARSAPMQTRTLAIQRLLSTAAIWWSVFQHRCVLLYTPFVAFEAIARRRRRRHTYVGLSRKGEESFKWGIKASIGPELPILVIAGSRGCSKRATMSLQEGDQLCAASTCSSTPSPSVPSFSYQELLSDKGKRPNSPKTALMVM